MTSVLTVRARDRDAGSILVVVKGDWYPNGRVFPRETPNGEPAGVYGFALRDRTLEPVFFVPMPEPSSTLDPYATRQFFAGDLDGDGDVELVGNLYLNEAPGILVFWAVEDSYVPLFLGGMRFHQGLDYDDDGDSELIVELHSDGVGDELGADRADGPSRREPDDERAKRQLWILGAGDRPIAPVPGRSTIRPEPPFAPIPAARRAIAARTEALVAMGLPAQAARVFEELAVVVGAEASAWAWSRAGQLWAAAGHHDRALAAYERAMTEAGRDSAAASDGESDGASDGAGARRVTAIIDALHSATRGDRFARAAELCEQLDIELTRELEVVADRRAELAETCAWLATLTNRDTVALIFDDSLGPSWRVADPLSLRRDARARALIVDSFTGQQDLAVLGLERTEARFGFEVAVTLEHVEWASRLEIRLRGRASDGFGMAVQGSGGARVYQHAISCPLRRLELGDAGRWEPTSMLPLERWGEPLELTARVEYIPGRDELLCVVADETGAVVHRARTRLRRPLPQGRYELVIGSGAEDLDGGLTWLRARLTGVTLWGLRRASSASSASSASLGSSVSPVVEDPVNRGHRLLANDDPVGALAAYTSGGPADLRSGDDENPARAARAFGTLLATIRQDRYRDAVGLLRQLHADPGLREPVTRHLERALRARTRTFTPLLRDVLGAGYLRLFWASWETAVRQHIDQPMVLRALTTGLPGLGEVEARALGPDGERVKLRFLAARGEAWYRLGRFGSARLDFQRAVAMIGASRLPAELGQELGDVHHFLAAMAASEGRREQALRHARDALAFASSPEVALDKLLLVPDLAALQRRAEWDAMLAP